MIELVKSIIPIARQIDSRADLKAILMHKTWVMLSPDGGHVRVVFRASDRIVIFQLQEVIEGKWELFEEVPSIVIDALGEAKNYDISVIDNGLIILGVNELHEWKLALIDVDQLPNSELTEKSISQFLIQRFDAQMKKQATGFSEQVEEQQKNPRPKDLLKEKRSAFSTRVEPKNRNLGSAVLSKVKFLSGEDCEFLPPLGTKSFWSGIKETTVLSGPNDGQYFYRNEGHLFCVRIVHKKVVEWYKMLVASGNQGSDVHVGQCVFTNRVRKKSPITNSQGVSLSGVFLINGYPRNVQDGRFIGN